MNLQTILAINALLLERTKLAGIKRAGAKRSPPAVVQAAPAAPTAPGAPA